MHGAWENLQPLLHATQKYIPPPPPPRPCKKIGVYDYEEMLKCHAQCPNWLQLREIIFEETSVARQNVTVNATSTGCELV